MKRDLLIELIRNAVWAEGYAFHTEEMHLVNGSVRVYPTAWLLPSAVRSHTGRMEGETTWHVTLHLMAMPAGGVTESVWQTLERDAIAIAESIAASPDVCAVQNIGCAPAKKSLTVHGEISIALTCDITLWYCS